VGDAFGFRGLLWACVEPVVDGRRPRCPARGTIDPRLAPQAGRTFPRLTPVRRVEMAALVCRDGGRDIFAFRGEWHRSVSLIYLVIPFGLWGALRFGLRGRPPAVSSFRRWPPGHDPGLGRPGRRLSLTEDRGDALLPRRGRVQRADRGGDRDRAPDGPRGVAGERGTVPPIADYTAGWEMWHGPDAG